MISMFNQISYLHKYCTWIFFKTYNLLADFSGNRIWSYVKWSLSCSWHSWFTFKDYSPLITNPKVFPSLCKVTSTVLKMRPDPCTAKRKEFQNLITIISLIIHTDLHIFQFKIAIMFLVIQLERLHYRTLRLKTCN